MKSIEQLKVFYEQDLLPLLKRYENIRLNVLAKIRYTTIVFITLIIIISMIIASRAYMPVLFLCVIGSFVLLWILLYKYFTYSYTSNFKYDIIGRVVKFVDDGLKYFPEDHINEDVYKASRLFKREPDRYKGEDLIKGQYGKTKLAFSELHSEYKTYSNKRTQWHTIFKGLFFMADFNKDFNGYTIVLQDIAQGLLGSLGQKLQSFSGRGQLVKLEDPEFEKAFVVYSDNQVEARYILTPALMQRIMEFKSKTKKNIQLSFIHSCVFIAIDNNKNMFEPRIFKTLLSFEPIEEYYKDLALAIGIVDDLNLNLRIWTKQ